MNRWILAAYLYVAALAVTLALFVDGCCGQRPDASVVAGPPLAPARVETVLLEPAAPALVVPRVDDVGHHELWPLAAGRDRRRLLAALRLRDDLRPGGLDGPCALRPARCPPDPGAEQA